MSDGLASRRGRRKAEEPMRSVLDIHFLTTSAIPHLGQLPGVLAMTSGCIGHVYMTIVEVPPAGACLELAQPVTRAPPAAVRTISTRTAKSL